MQGLKRSQNLNLSDYTFVLYFMLLEQKDHPIEMSLATMSSRNYFTQFESFGRAG